MASDWIKMRPGMANHAKVTAMARYLCQQSAFLKWFLGDVCDDRHVTRHEIVTHSVTFGIVTRVTVASLLDVWGAVNHVLKDDDRVPFMALEDVDRIAGIPHFGEAMAFVDWVDEHEAQGLVFPNFSEFNTPEAKRKTAKSQAQRSREYRERMKAEQGAETPRHDRHETSRGVEESREESSTTNPARDEPGTGTHPAATPPPTATGADGRLSHGEIRQLVIDHGAPYQLCISQKGRDAINAWAAAGVTGADLATAIGQAHGKNRDGPIGPAYLDPFVRHVVSERTTPRNQRENHGKSNSRNHGNRASERAASLLAIAQGDE